MSLNFCEILSPALLKKRGIEEIIKKAREEENVPLDRIYLGSNFCSQFFLKSLPHWEDVFDYANDNDIKITLTLPIFSQKDVSKYKIVLNGILENPAVDEVTVNDFGSLNYLQNEFETKINLGRLFFKDPRDIRVPGYYKLKSTPSALSNIDLFGKISGVELDFTTRELTVPADLPEELTVSLHYPYTYMTTGNICKFASINKDTEHKFRPNDNCGLECSRIHEFFHESFDDENERELFRFGRSVYFLNDEAKLSEESRKENLRFVYFPLKELALFTED